MTSPVWEEVEVPRGAFIGWGNRPGQSVIGRVLSYSTSGGTDINGNACPQLSLELTEACDTYRDKGATREELPVGEMVVVNAGLVSLRRGLLAAGPQAGDLIKMTFADLVRVDKGEVKEFKIQIARGAGGSSRASQSSSSYSNSSAAQTSAPPF